MAELKDADLHSLLTEAAARERRALKRATLYTAIPVLIGLLLVGFSVYQVVNLNQRKEALNKEVDILEKEQASLQESVREEAKVIKQNSAALEKAKPIVQSVKEGNTALKKEAQLSLEDIQTASENRWVVVGVDTTLDAARSELKKANQFGYSDAFIYLRQNIYRTVIKFPNETIAADNLLIKIHPNLYQAAYLINLEQWCPNPQQRAGYFQCLNFKS